MPRRASARSALHTTNQQQSTSSVAPTATTSLPDDLILLRTQWKWAAFSQFFFTFSPLLAMDDITLNNVEEDLVHGHNLYLPRIIVRLLFTLTYDRKISLNNWQSALRRQYSKRDPGANPIGPEPPKDNASSRYTSVIEGSVSPEPESRRPTTDVDHSSEVTQQDEVESHVKSEEEVPESSSRSQKVASNEPPQEDQLQQETKDWLTLPMLEKLDSLHLLTEWQFQKPIRLRQLMKSDDEEATWRIEPIGYDAKRNAYWLIGADRLWLQRVPPKPPRPSPNKNKLKRKRGDTTRTFSASNKRPRLQTSSKRNDSPAIPDSPATGRRGRAAKAQANLKLDAQAKQLAELNRQATSLARSGSSTRSSRRQQAGSVSPPKSSTSRGGRTGTRSQPLGTRVSARLRGTQEDEWQTIPDEWLNGHRSDDDYENENTDSRSPRKTGLESDKSSVSDLTELSESDREGTPSEKEEDEDNKEEGTVDPVPESESELQEVKTEGSQDFIEWETICVTLYEWEHIAERWQNATHYAEKALYKVLTNQIVPIITEELREIENKRRMEEAIVHRKRSSRIAMKESEKEEARAAARKKVEEDEKMGRQRRAEARAQREEAERAKREQAREQRRKEREVKDAEEKKDEEEESEKVDVEDADNPVRGQRATRKKPSVPVLNSTSTSRPRTAKSNDWEVDCEICQRRGTNIDDGVPMMSCGICSKWQHIACHDRADQAAGHMRRDWKKVDFYCRRCRERAAMNGTGGHHQRQYQQSLLLHPPNAHPSLRTPSGLNNGSISPYNHMPYGQSTPSHHGSSNPLLSNGYADYALQSGAGKGYATVSDIRSSGSHSQLPVTSSYSPAMSSKQISFAHYQPQQHGFTSYPIAKAPLRQQSSYGLSSPQIQAYGLQQQSTHNQYTTYMNGQTQSYSRQVPNSTWNGNTTQTMGLPSLTSYAPSAERSSASTQTTMQDVPHQNQHYTSQQWPAYQSPQNNNMTYTSSYQHPS